MIKYKRVDTANGRIMYFKNGKMVSKDDIPAGIVNSLENGVELSVGTPDPETVDEANTVKAQSPQSKICIFCKKESSRTKFINLETVYLCDEDYESHTTGEIAEQMRTIKES